MEGIRWMVERSSGARGGGKVIPGGLVLEVMAGWFLVWGFDRSQRLGVDWAYFCGLGYLK